MNDLETGEPVLGRILESALQFVYPQLELDVEGMEEVSSKDDRVDRSVDCVYPACRDEDGLSLFQLQFVTLVHHVTKEGFRLRGESHPSFIEGQVSGRRTDQEEMFFTFGIYQVIRS